MKRFEKYVLLLALPLMACSTSKMSNVAQDDDNVYVSNARAKEYEPWVRPETAPSENVQRRSTTYSDNQYEDYDRYDEIDYLSYSSRIYRFNYYSPWRNYYDPWFDPFYYNSSFYYYDRYYYRTMPSWSFNLYYGNAWYDPWYAYNPYWRYRYGDIYSYYRTAPYPYYGGYYGGGNNYPSFPRYNRPRPGRNTENLASGAIYRNGGSSTNSRADRYNGNNPAPSSVGPRPSRANANPPSGESRPTRTEQYNPPPSRNDNGSSGSTRRNDSNESKPRPSRGGGR